ncbi:MAG: hypothetical protein JJT89_07965 [Nitriliruptoraceae bacterium]|nr:hypothetical protein [Nitriliruptoraceae bacterium]
MSASTSPTGPAERDVPVRRERRRRPSARVRRAMLAAGGIAIVVVSVLIAGPPRSELPYDPTSIEPRGTAAMVDLLEGLDVEVDVSTRLDVDTVFDGVEAGAAGVRVFVAIDRLGDDQRAQLRDLAAAGATVVVADPESPIHDVAPVGVPVGSAFGRTSRAPECDALGVVGEVRHGDWTMLGDEASADAAEATGARTVCFPAPGDVDGEGWLLAVPVGDGQIIALGSPEPFTNALLGEADNAVFAAALLGPRAGDRLIVLPRGELASEQTPLLELVPDAVLRGLVLLGVALVVAVLWRSRRLGPPVPEQLPPVLPSAELARSVGGLLHRAGDRGGVAARLQDAAGRDLALAMRVPVDTPTDDLLVAFVSRFRFPEDRARLALQQRPVSDDEELLEIARAVQELRAALSRPNEPAGTVTTDGSRDR